MELDSPGIWNLRNSDKRKVSMVFLEDNIRFLERLTSDFPGNISMQQEPNNVEQEKQSERNIKGPIETVYHSNITSDGLQYNIDVDEDEDEEEPSLEYVLDSNDNKKVLGQGAFGKVYSMRCKNNKKKLAMKIIQSAPSSESIRNEIAIHGGILHENIIKLIDSFEDEGTWFIVLECIPGASLADLLASDWKGPQSEKVVVFYTSQLLKAMKYLHDRQIVHCDVKPANILIDEYHAILKLCDFGNAQRLEGDSGLKKDSCGTSYYMAPEAINIPEIGYGKPVDIWSTGCTVIEFLSGRPPHGYCEPQMIMYQVGRYHKLPDFPQHISDACKDFLTSCFEIEPTKRATINELMCHEFISGCQGNGMKEMNGNKKPLENTENEIHIDQADLDENDAMGEVPIVDHNVVRDEEDLMDYNPYSNVVAQKSRISKELYGGYESSWENIHNAGAFEDDELSIYLKNLDVPEEEIRKFTDQECTLKGLLMHMELGDLKDLNLKIGYRSRIWHHIQLYRNQKEGKALNNAFWDGLHFCATLYNEYMKI